MHVCALLAGLFAVTCVAITAFATFEPLFEPAHFAPADAIVVLGAGMEADGTLHQSTVLRVEAGVRLYIAGAAPKMLFTGGRGGIGGPGAGSQMALLAQSMGVPAESMMAENASQSTLQNALFSQPFLTDSHRLILVTEGYHLPRSWASIKWAGGHELALAHSTPFREATPGSRFPRVSMVLREALAWWFNLARALVWTLGGWLGWPNDLRDGWLA